MGNQLTTIDQESRALTARDIREQVNLIQEVMKAVMKNGVHYGVIPGCPKPSLFKAGAEKIAATFRIAVKSEVEDLSTDDEKHYRVTCTGHAQNGIVLGSAVGECSSNEEKFRWRSPVCDEEFEETDMDRKREKWVKGFKGAPAFKKKQIRTEPSDLANTILQLADKRAYVAVVRKITAASDVFTQDIEDLPEEVREDMVQEESKSSKPSVAMPEKKTESETTPAPEPQATMEILVCSECQEEISEKVHKYSTEKFGRDLCFNCQKKAGK